ncbi:MAG: cation:proton antiporter [Burkholderiaceae bacterium]|nr:cation:proton antiporter [Burkholderiaceae bacterium]MCD8536160.1 cation:proton antiporter [Burkholderiaceae bacterium]MCD8565024.1 cation:proton antiporter [Burkholderiaceae bacterium]
MATNMLIFGLAGLLVLVCFLSPLASALRIPATLLLSVVGALLGYLIHVHDWAPAWLADSLELLQAFEIPSETILVVFLPVLLFETALNTNVRGLFNDIAPILLLAVVAVFICTFFVGWGVSFVSSYSLAACLLLGAIIATTDPAAVVSIFKEVGAPKRLTTIVEGESLLNDAAAIALYSVMLGVVSHTVASPWGTGSVLASFTELMIGGAISGYLIGRLACSALPLLRGWPTAEISLTVATAYIAYIIPEHYFGWSGVVSTVVAGLVVSSVGRTRMTPTTAYALAQSWRQFGFWASSLIFLFAAMMIPRLLANATWHDLLIVFVTILAALAARAVTVYGLLPGLTAMVGTRVDNRYKAVICWGGLRGALSLALALSVTEHDLLSDDISNFVAIGATGFVLSTLVINGLTLRPLINFLELNKLSPLERALRNQAVVITVNDLQAETKRIAVDEQISRQARAKIDDVFDASITSVTDTQIGQFDEEDRVRLGLSMIANRQSELILVGLGEQGFDRRTAERLLSVSERMEDDVKALGMAGFEKSIGRSLQYPRSFKMVLRLHQAFGLQSLLSKELGQRFVELVGWRWVTRRLIAFANNQIRPMLGDSAADTIQTALRARLARVEENMQALRLQYPSFAEWLEQSYLGRLARTLERSRYRKMLEESLISPEVYDDLLERLEDRWAFLNRAPSIDVELGPEELAHRVPLLADLPDETLRKLTRKLKTRLTLPNQLIQGPNKPNPSLYFVASGAVSVLLPDATHIELGSGEFFGELYLLNQDATEFEVRSLGYTKLLELTAKDFKALLARDESLRTAIEAVAKQRLRALEVGRAELLNSAGEPEGFAQ